MKPSIHAVPMTGVIPVTHNLDSVGAMAKSPADLAAVTELIMDPSALPARRFSESMTGEWNGLRIGFLDETVWELPHFLCEPNDEALTQMASRKLPKR